MGQLNAQTKVVDKVLDGTLSSMLEMSLMKVAPPVLATWRPEIVDPALRTALIENPYLADIILNDLRVQYGIPKTFEKPVFKQSDLLHKFMTTDQTAVFVILGCAWNADAISRMVTRSARNRDVFDIGRTTLRTAISHRNRVPPAQDDTILTHDKIIRDGQNCFVCWLDTLPINVAGLVILQVALPRISIRRDHQTLRASLCAQILRDIPALDVSP